MVQDGCWIRRPASMVRPYSTDLRERVVSAVLAGERCRAVAARYEVAVSSVVKWSQRYRRTGSVAPDKMGGYRRRVLEPHRDFIVERINQEPHLTLHRLRDELAARGVAVSHNTVWLFLRREGLRFKKTLFALEQARVDVARHRKRWKNWQARLDPEHLVFIDETLPIRLSPTPTICSVHPFSGVKLGAGRSGDISGDAEQGLGRHCSGF